MTADQVRQRHATRCKDLARKYSNHADWCDRMAKQHPIAAAFYKSQSDDCRAWADAYMQEAGAVG